MTEDPLRGKRILNTRPCGQGAHLRNLLEARGAECVDLPLIQIKPAQDQRRLQSELAAGKKARAWIFTSANAVHQARILDQDGWPPCFAIGPATARALIESGHSEVFTAASGSSSEALLAHPDLQAVEDQELLICTGRGGLTQIEDTLRKRGARVRRIELYYRERLAHPDETVRQAIQAAQGIIFTSGEALTQLFERAAETDRKKMLAAFLVVPSPRVIELAQSLGFANVSAPAHTSDETLIDCLARAFTQAARDPLEKTMTDDAKAPNSPVDSPSDSPAEKIEPSPPPLSAADRKEQKERLRAELNKRNKSSGSKAGAFVAVAMGVIILGLMAVVGYAGWLLMQERSQMSERLAAQNEKVLQMGQRVDSSTAATADIKQDLGRLERKLEAASGDLQALQKKVEDGLAQMGRVAAEISGGRARFELASVEHLLALANDRIQIAGDVKGALTALQGADDRLARLADPQMFPVRAKLAEELTALKAVKVAEIGTASLSLASLIQQVPNLPLAIQAPREFENSEASSDTSIELDAGWKRFLESIKEAASSLFNVRRDDDAKILRLLSPEAETAVYDILTLKLEGARVSMLKGNTAAMRAQLLSASSWLRQQFRSDDTAVVAMSAELEHLGTLELSPALPDISSSLVTLRRKLKDSE